MQITTTETNADEFHRLIHVAARSSRLTSAIGTVGGIPRRGLPGGGDGR